MTPVSADGRELRSLLVARCAELALSLGLRTDSYKDLAARLWEAGARVVPGRPGEVRMANGQDLFDYADQRMRLVAPHLFGGDDPSRPRPPPPPPRLALSAPDRETRACIDHEVSAIANALKVHPAAQGDLSERIWGDGVARLSNGRLAMKYGAELFDHVQSRIAPVSPHYFSGVANTSPTPPPTPARSQSGTLRQGPRSNLSGLSAAQLLAYANGDVPDPVRL